MLVFDANVLVHAANKYSDISQPCRERLEEARRDPAPAFLTWSICYEFLRVSTHPRTIEAPWKPPAAWGLVQRLLDASGFEMLVATSRHAAVLERTLAELPAIRGSAMHDVHIAVLMREHGISRICTRDAGFHRFPFLTVVDPLGDL